MIAIDIAPRKEMNMVHALKDRSGLFEGEAPPPAGMIESAIDEEAADLAAIQTELNLADADIAASVIGGGVPLKSARNRKAELTDRRSDLTVRIEMLRARLLAAQAFENQKAARQRAAAAEEAVKNAAAFLSRYNKKLAPEVAAGVKAVLAAVAEAEEANKVLRAAGLPEEVSSPYRQAGANEFFHVMAIRMPSLRGAPWLNGQVPFGWTGDEPA